MGLLDLFKKKETPSEGWKYYTLALNHPEQKEEYLEKAVALNEPHAMCALARFILENRLLTQKNLRRVVQLYEDAEAAGAMPTYAKLAFAYSKLGEEEKAIACYQKGAESGQADAQDILGMLYHTGKGVKQDDRKAFELVHDAAEAGNLSACGHLAYFLYHGKGTAKDDEAALRWARKALDDEKNPYARYVMAMLYKDGKVVELDYLTALYKMKKLINEGMEEARQGLEWIRADAAKEAARLFCEGREEKNMDKIRQAANLDDMHACFEMVCWILKDENRGQLDQSTCLRSLNYYDEYQRQRKEGKICPEAMGVDVEAMQLDLANTLFKIANQTQGVISNQLLLERLLPYGYAAVFFNLGLNMADQEYYSDAYYYLEQAKTGIGADEDLRRKADDMIKRIKRIEAEN